MVGAAQNATRKPSISGWRTTRYSARTTNGDSSRQRRPRAWNQAWRRPNRSKWLIRKVLYTSGAQPSAASACSAMRAFGSATSQTQPGEVQHRVAEVAPRRLVLLQHVVG